MKKLLAIIFLLFNLMPNTVWSISEKDKALIDKVKKYKYEKNKLNILKRDRDLHIALTTGKQQVNTFSCSSSDKNIDFNFKEKNVETLNKKKETVGCLSGDCNNGNGTYKNHTGLVFKGKFKEGRLHGKGVLIFPKSPKDLKHTKITTYFKNGCANGSAKVEHFSGAYYEGRYDMNKKIGFKKK